MGMFRTLLNDFNSMFKTGTDPHMERILADPAEVFDTTPEEWMPDDMDRRTIRYAPEEDDLDTPHMVKVTIDRAGVVVMDTGTMTYQEIAAAASEFRRIANKLAHEASQMKKWAYKEVKKWERQSP